MNIDKLFETEPEFETSKLLLKKITATRLIIEYGFMQLGFNRIEGRCSYNNAGSTRAMEKLGMRWEGILRGQLKMKGEFVDQRMYAILRDDFDRVNISSTL